MLKAQQRQRIQVRVMLTEGWSSLTDRTGKCLLVGKAKTRVWALVEYPSH